MMKKNIINNRFAHILLFCAALAVLIAGSGMFRKVSGQTSPNLTISVPGGYKVGELWNLSLTGGQSGLPVKVCATQNIGGVIKDHGCNLAGDLGLSAAVGPFGDWKASGIFPLSAVGDWTEYVMAGDTKSNEINFTIPPFFALSPYYTDIKPNSLTVNWAPVAGAPSYTLERSENEVTYSQVAVTSATSTSDSGLAAGKTYHYRVKATGSTTYLGKTSVNTTLSAPGQSTPYKTIVRTGDPWTLVVAGAPASTFVSICSSFNGASRGCSTASSLRLPASTDTNGFWSGGEDIQSWTVGEWQESATIGSVSSNNIYFTIQSPVVIPPAPGAPTFTNITTTTLTVSWTASTGAAKYKLERNTGGTWTQIATPTGTTYNDTGRLPGEYYYYRVTAIDSAGINSPTSPQSLVQMLPPAPSTPTYYSVGTSTVGVKWGLVNFASYELQRSPSGLAGTFTLIASPSRDRNTYLDSGLTPGTKYYYRVRARNESGYGDYSSSSSVSTTGTAATRPATPTAPTYANVASTTLTVNWTSATGADSYKLERSVTGAEGSFALVASPTGTTYNDSGLIPLTTYYYRARGYNAAAGDGLNSPSSSVKTASSNVPPQAPSQDSPLANATGVSTLPVLFMTSVDADGDALKYKVTLYSNSICTTVVQSSSQVDSATGWSAVSYASGDQAAYTIQTELATSTTFYWKASAIDTAGSNTWTDSVTCNNFTTSDIPGGGTTTIGKPDAPTYANITTSTVTVNWSVATGATSYRLQRSTSGAVFSDIATPPSNTYNDSGLSSSTTYYYRVRGEKGSSFGLWSASSSLRQLACTADPLSGSASLPVTYTATGGVGSTFSWKADGVTLADTASSVTVNYPNAGTKIAQVTNLGFTVDCPSVTVTAPVIPAACGSANGQSLAVAPATQNLCAAGNTASSVSGPGPWDWTCSSAGATPPSVNCSADVTTTAPKCALSSLKTMITIPPAQTVKINVDCTDIQSCTMTSVDAFGSSKTEAFNIVDTSWESAPTSSTKYTINCTGPAGQASSTISIRVINLDIKETGQ